MGSKFKGGQGLVKITAYRNTVAFFETAAQVMRNPVRNSNLIISQGDYNGMRITPDGLLALCGSTGAPFLRVLDPVAEAWVTPIATTPPSSVNSIAFTSAGDRFAVAFQSSPFLYEYAYPSFILQPTPLVPPASAVAGVSYNGAGTKLALALFATPYLEIYDVATATKDAITFSGMPATGTGADVSFNTAGTMVALSGSAGAVRMFRVWDFPSGTLIHSETAANSSQKCEFSPDDTKLAVFNGTAQIRIYNTSTWAFTTITLTSFSDFYVQFARNLKWIDSRFLFFNSEGGSCVILDTVTGLPVAGVEHGATAAVGIGVISPLSTPRKLAGNVTDAGLTPAARLIRAYDSETGAFMGETTSDPVTGDFEMLVFSSELMTVYAIGEGTENAKIYDPVTPAAWP